eukprot:gene32419-36599_t
MNTVAAIQMISSPSVGENLATARRLIAQAAGTGAKLVLLPEYWAIMGLSDGEIWADYDKPETPPTTEHKSGFVSFVGRPNAGKSTLTNALVGSKVVITSSKPQTTRTVVRGIVHRPDAQLILVDTP